jgi:hypothetical protein
VPGTCAAVRALEALHLLEVVNLVLHVPDRATRRRDGHAVGGVAASLEGRVQSLREAIVIGLAVLVVLDDDVVPGETRPPREELHAVVIEMPGRGR